MRLSNLNIKTQVFITVCIITVIIVISVSTFFFGGLAILSDNAKTYSDNIINQLNSSTESLVKTAKVVSFLLSYNEDIQKLLIIKGYDEKLYYTKKAREQMSNILAANDEILGLCLMDNEGSYYIEKKAIDYVPVLKYVAEEIKNENEIKFSEPTNIDNQTITVAMLPVFEQNSLSKTKIGSCFVIISLKSITQNIAQLKKTSDMNTFFLNENSKVILGQQNEYDLIKKELNSRNCITVSKKIDIANWQIFCVTKTNIFTSNMLKLLIITILILLCAVIFVVLLGLILNNNLKRSINNITDFSENMNMENIEKRLPISQQSDFSKLFKNINILLDRYTDIKHKYLENEMLKNEAQLKALQSQINPHFLYNTLECIRAIAAQNNIKEIMDISYSMAKIFRYSIKKDENCTVADEVECIKDYLKIIEIRLMGKFNFSIDVKDEILDYKCLKMCLQPIVENSFIHGLEKIKKSGYIEIKGYKDEDKIIFEITDNGCGMGIETLEKVKDSLKSPSISKSNIGLVNINSRIKLSFGSESGINIAYSNESGTKILIILKC
jgi:two-component system sensor histidine kinase YesM